MKHLVILILVCFAGSAFAANLPANQTEKRHFAKANPCPATKAPIPSCKGYRIDHIVPICAGGTDTAANMQWQTVEASRLKDAIEISSCACNRSKHKATCPVVTWK